MPKIMSNLRYALLEADDDGDGTYRLIMVSRNGKTRTIGVVNGQPRPFKYVT